METKDLRNYTKLNVYLNRSCDVLRHKFKVEWNRKYNEEWNDKSCQQLINILPQNYVKNLGKIQRNNVKCGNIDEWDISLFKQLLLNKQLFSLSPNDEKSIQELGDIRNKTAHYGSQNMSDCEFETYRKQLCDAIIALGDNEDELKKLECDDSIGGIEFSSDDVNNDENTAEAKTLKELGNKEFSCENYDKAIKYYTSAIVLAGLPSTDRAMLYSNRCICYFKLNDLENASKDAKEIVKLWPQWWKGYYRKAQVYNAINDYESLNKAEKCLMQAQSHENKEEITALLNELRQKIGPIERHEVLDYRKHFTSTEEIVDYYNQRTGLNVNVNIVKEIEKRNAESDNPVYKSSEDCRRGHRYRCGTDGFPLDYERAAQCYSKAANRGSADGLYNLYQMYSEGKGVKQDFKLALQYLLKAAQQPPYIGVEPNTIKNVGVMEAEHTLGLCYETGKFVKKDLRKAMEWYKKAVEHEGSSSANNLGLIYMHGIEFVDKDLDKAEQLLRFAATKGDPNAMANIIRLYIEKDEPELALQWCERIRNKGYALPDLDNLETIAKTRLSELKKAYKDFYGRENINEENTNLTLREKLSQTLSESFPIAANIEQKIIEIEEKCFNHSKSPLNNNFMGSYVDMFEYSTLEKYADSGKLYAKKLLTAKIHFLNAIKVLQSIRDINNPSDDECRNFIKHLSLSIQIESIVSFVTEDIEQLISFALNKKTSYNEDVRMCCTKLNMKDIDGNINFLSESLKLYPKNAYLLYIRGAMLGFRNKFEKSILDFNSALKLVPNDEEILYLKAASMSKLENIDYNLTIDAYNQFLLIAPEDHRKIPASYYSMAQISLLIKKDFNSAQKYYNMGIQAEEKQLSFFLPYDFPIKSAVELLLQLKHKENIAIQPKEVKSKNKQLTNPYRIQIIKKHRQNINEFNKWLKNNSIRNSVKPPKIQKCAQSLADLKYICLRDMDPTTDKIYEKCVIDLKVIDIVGTTGSSLTIVVEDNRKDVERCYIYNSLLLNDIKEANKLYGVGCQFSVINPYLRIAKDLKPAIRIDDINSIVMRQFITDMCRYCCESNANKHCSRCKTALYCSRECQEKDFKQNSHKYICY